MKNRKQRTFSPVVFIGILAILAIMVTACTPKSARTGGSTQAQTSAVSGATVTNDTEEGFSAGYDDSYEGGPGDDYEALPAGFGYPYSAIMDGDLDEFAGTWVNVRGERRQLRRNGTFNAGETAYGFTRGADINSQYIENGTNYEWIVNMGGEAGGFEVWLFPVGVGIKNYGGEIVQTDKTKNRLCIESVSSSADVYYMEWDMPTDSYAKIMNGDLSGFTGTWVNARGQREQLRADGTFGAGQAGAFWKSDGDANVYYEWGVHFGGESTGMGVALYPPGTEAVDMNYRMLLTDTTKVRLTIGNLGSRDEVYYREGESPVLPINRTVALSGDILLGSWGLPEGSQITFFAQAPLIDFLPDGTVSVYEQSPDRLFINKTADWALWTVNEKRFVIDTVDGYSYHFVYEISGDTLTIIDANGNRVVLRRIYG